MPPMDVLGLELDCDKVVKSLKDSITKGTDAAAALREKETEKIAAANGLASPLEPEQLQKLQQFAKGIKDSLELYECFLDTKGGLLIECESE